MIVSIIKKGNKWAASILVASLVLIAGTCVAGQMPDLAISGMTAPSSAAPGELISVIFTVQNIGTRTTKASILSSSVDGIPTGTASIKGLAAGASYVGSLNLTVPSTLADGTYTLALTADSTGIVKESNESNNTRSLPLIITAPPPPSGDAILTWEPSISASAIGYNIYMGTASGVYGAVFDVGDVTTYTLTDLAAGYTYYFAATAYDIDGLQSVFSNEVSKTIP